MIYEDRLTLHYRKLASPVYFRIEAHRDCQVCAGLVSTIFSDLDEAKRYKGSLIE